MPAISREQINYSELPVEVAERDINLEHSVENSSPNTTCCLSVYASDTKE